MGMKYWLALANLVWLGCLPAGAVHATEAQVVVAASETGHDWYQGSQAEQARVELEQQLHQALLEARERLARREVLLGGGEDE